MPRKNHLATGEYYHVFNKSIAGFRIFNNQPAYHHMIQLMRYYQLKSQPCKFSQFIRADQVKMIGLNQSISDLQIKTEKLVKIVAFCLMPTHIHLLLQQLEDDGVMTFMRNISNSYSHYFNIKNDRRGPLWVGRFKNILIDDNSYLLNLMRYIHRNPVEAQLVQRPEDWFFSSYFQYLNFENPHVPNLCSFENEVEMSVGACRRFVEDYLEYQKSLEILTIQ
jgi:putative transposase